MGRKEGGVVLFICSGADEESPVSFAVCSPTLIFLCFVTSPAREVGVDCIVLLWILGFDFVAVPFFYWTCPRHHH